MSTVFFYNLDCEPIQQVPGFISLNISKKYCGFGTAEIHLPITRTEVIGMLKDNPYIICIANDMQMIVTGWKLGEDIAIFGRTPEWLLTKRVVAPFSYTQKTPVEIANYAVQTAAGDFADVSEVEIEGEGIDYSAKEPKTVYDTLCGVLKPSGLGFRLSADIKKKKFVFSVCKGEELPLLISASNRTACDMSYTRDIQKIVDNCGWYMREMINMGDWNAVSNLPTLTSEKADNYCTYYKIIVAGTRFGLNCKAGEYLYCDTADGVWKVTADKPTTTWVYIDNSKTDGAARWEGILQGIKTHDEANAEFAGMKAVEESETALRHVEYGTDYTEGDIVRIQTQFGDYRCTERKRVSVVEVFYDIDTVGAKPTLESLEE